MDDLTTWLRAQIDEDERIARIIEPGVACAACGTDDSPEVWPCRHVRLLALPYADRPGYREEWRR